MISERDEEEIPTFKVTVFGDSGVGKTSLLIREMLGKFNSYVPSTIGVDYRMKLIQQNENGAPKSYKLQIWDVAGQERFNSIVSMYARGSDISLVVSDSKKELQTDSVKRWVQHIRDKAGNIPIIFILNKCDKEEFENWMRVDQMKEEDLKSDENDFFANQELRIRAICRELNLEPPLKVSAKDNLNIDKIFGERLREAIFSNKLNKDSPGLNRNNMKPVSTKSSSLQSSFLGKKNTNCQC